MFDFDPRDHDDARDQRDRDERDRDDDALGRDPSRHVHYDERHDRDDGRHDARERADHRDREDARWPYRDRDPRGRGADPRDAFTRGLDLPRGRNREIVYDARNGDYTPRGSESRRWC
jgi:hypothetical protein